MNWRRGIFRLWLLASAIWMLWMFAYTGGVPFYFTPHNEITTWPIRDILGIAEIFFLPPALLGLAILIIAWVLAGFRAR
jgi:hypothetical protein